MIDPLRLRALDLAQGLSATPSHLARVARETSDEAARWAFGQWEMRGRGRAKFAFADRMLFVREALEQATHEKVAAYHASQFPVGALVADLTVGIGADLVALARRGPSVGFELDEERASCAEWNVRCDPWRGGPARETPLSSPEVVPHVDQGWGAVTVRIADSLAAEWGFDYAFADPARRVEGRRTLDPKDFAPDPVELARRMQGLRLGGIKLTPLLADSFLESLGPCIEFVSFGGECREALVWTGSEASAGRWAVHVESGSRLAASPPPDSASEPDAYLFEADPAAIRAHALGALGSEYGLSALGDSNGYLSGERLVSSPWLKAYRVLYHGKADLKATKRALRSLSADRPVLKQRGGGLDLERLRKEFVACGSRRVALAIWPVGASLRHTIVELGL